MTILSDIIPYNIERRLVVFFINGSLGFLRISQIFYVCVIVLLRFT